MSIIGDGDPSSDEYHYGRSGAWQQADSARDDESADSFAGDMEAANRVNASVTGSVVAMSDSVPANIATGTMEATFVGCDGYDVRHYGRGVVARPLIHRGDCEIEWAEYNDAFCTDQDGVFKPMRAVRYMCDNQPASFLMKGAVKASDFVTPKDESQRRRVEGSARLLGIFSAAASKGYANGKHSQLEPYKDLEEKKLYEKKCEMEPFKKYVYTLLDENDPGSKGYRAPMFVYGCEAVYDQDGTHIICFRWWKFVFDHEHSDSYAWKKILEENSEGVYCSRMNRSSRYKRNSRVLQDCKMARNLTRTKDISDTGENLYLNLTNVSDLRMLYKVYAGTTEDSDGAPVFDETTLPAGMVTHELYACKDKELGGLHPYGPETALNAQRLPSSGPTEACPLTAGMVDLQGNLLVGHEEQMHPSKYFNEEGDFVLPKFVQSKGAFKIMVNPYQTSIFDAELPFPTSGSEDPDDNILMLFWEEQKDTHRVLVAARKHARMRGVGDDNWEDFRDEIYRAIGQQMSERDGLSRELCRAMRESKLCGKDSFDLTDEERATARAVPEWCSYEMRTLEPFQILKQLSLEITNLYSFIRRWRFECDRSWKSDRAKVNNGNRREIAKLEERKLAYRRRHTELRRSVIKLALQKMQNAFESQNHRRSIPPGWLAIWDSLQEEIKRAGVEAAKCHGKRPGSMIVDPMDPNSSVGSAAVGQLFGTGYNNFDLNSQGMFMELTMQLLNGEQGIQGPSTFITIAMHYAQYQVAQPMSFILAICGAGSTGKSERAVVMMDTQLPGWWVSGGGKSELADFNGMGRDCGRMIHMDEVTKEFTTTGEATERIKETTMKNSCTRSRTVKKKNANGDEDWETKIEFSLHYEAIVITSNCGFCLQHGNDEPSEQRAPLFDRMIVFPAPEVTNVKASSKEATRKKSNTVRGVKTCERIIQYRIICGLTWKVLLLIKHIPDFHPGNSEWAQRLLEDMDETLISTVPNLQRSTLRKQELRNMTLLSVCVQKEVVRKFLTVEGCMLHEDLQATNGYLPPWTITQLVDVIQHLNYSPADVFEAWSHSLDYSPSTSSISFHIRQMVAMSHGVEMDDRFPKSGTASPPIQTVDIAADQSTRRKDPPMDDILYPVGNLPQVAGDAGSSSQSQEQQAVELQRKEHIRQARQWANQVVTGTTVHSPMAEEMDLTVDVASRRTDEMSRKRQLVCHAIKTRRDVYHEGNAGDVVTSLKNLLHTGTERRTTPGGDQVTVPVTRCGDLPLMDAADAAGCIMPTLNDVLCCGYESTMLLRWLTGNPTDTNVSMDRRLGTYRDRTSWSFVCINSDPREATAAQFNTMWRVIKGKPKGEKDKEPSAEKPGWSEAARAIMKGGSESCNSATYGENIGITRSNLKDGLWMISTCTKTLVGKNNSRVFVDKDKPYAVDSDAVCTAANGAMRGVDANFPDWTRSSPVVCNEADNGAPVRAFGAEMWNSARPDAVGSMRFVADRPLYAYDRKEELVVRRFQKLFQVGGLPACNPFSIGAVEIGSMIRMERGEMHVNSLSLIQHMRLFMEIAYFFSVRPDTRNKSGIAVSKIPAVLKRTLKHSRQSMEMHRDVTTHNGAHPPEGGLLQRSVPTHSTPQDGFQPDTQGDPVVEDLCRDLVNGASEDGREAGDAEDDGASAMEQDGVDDENIGEHTGIDSTRIQTLGFGFEMFTMWATIKMVERWSNDCDQHVKFAVKELEHLFGSAEQVLNQLPKFTTKFCAFSNMADRHRVSEDEVNHVPVSVEILRKSNYEKKLPGIESFNSNEIHNIKRDFERFLQRSATEDELNDELNSRLLSIGGIPNVSGNLWSRTTWDLATYNDLIARGQAHGGEDDTDLYHVRDSDLDIRHRMWALFAKANPDNEKVQKEIGSRKDARYNNNRMPTVSEMDEHKKNRAKYIKEYQSIAKKQRVEKDGCYANVPVPVCGAFTSMLNIRRQSDKAGASDTHENEDDAMDHELPPQEGV
jgi:hypothetical protein